MAHFPNLQVREQIIRKLLLANPSLQKSNSNVQALLEEAQNLIITNEGPRIVQATYKHLVGIGLSIETCNEVWKKINE